MVRLVLFIVVGFSLGKLCQHFTTTDGMELVTLCVYVFIVGMYILSVLTRTAQEQNVPRGTGVRMCGAAMILSGFIAFCTQSDPWFLVSDVIARAL